MINLLLIISYFLTSVGLNDVRETYFLAVNSEEKTDLLIELTKENKSTLYTAYLGVGYTLKASFGYNPIKKLDNFEKGKKLIDSSVKNSPENVEIRFLRLTVQEGSPALLNYKDNIKKDREFIKKELNISKLPSWYKKKIHEYLNKR